MLKQKARAIALGVQIWDLVLTALSLPSAYLLRRVVLPKVLPTVFRPQVAPIEAYLRPPEFMSPVLSPDATHIALGLSDLADTSLQTDPIQTFMHLAGRVQLTAEPRP